MGQEIEVYLNFSVPRDDLTQYSFQIIKEGRLRGIYACSHRDERFGTLIRTSLDKLLELLELLLTYNTQHNTTAWAFFIEQKATTISIQPLPDDFEEGTVVVGLNSQPVKVFDSIDDAEFGVDAQYESLDPLERHLRQAFEYVRSIGES